MITFRVAYLIATGVPAEAIMLVTFTRRAAREMIHRLEPLIGEQANRVWAGTFHHIGNRLLRRAAPLLGYQPNFTILDSEDQLDLIRLAMDDAGLTGTGKMAPRPAEVQHLISFAANIDRPLAEVSPSAMPSWPMGRAIARSRGLCRPQARRQLHGLRRPALQWGRLIREFPEQARSRAGCSATC